jgi:hypothetical protein
LTTKPGGNDRRQQRRKQSSPLPGADPVPARPIPESYWVIPGRFLAGEYPTLPGDEDQSLRRLRAFLEAGLDTFIDLTDGNERPPYFPLLRRLAEAERKQVLHCRATIRDFNVPSRDEMTTILNAIDLALSEGHKVYLHCVGGIGRTGTTVACWLIRHGMEPPEALQQLQRLYQTSQQSQFYSHSPEAEEQVRFLLEWHEHGLA